MNKKEIKPPTAEEKKAASAKPATVVVPVPSPTSPPAAPEPAPIVAIARLAEKAYDKFRATLAPPHPNPTGAKDAVPTQHPGFPPFGEIADSETRAEYVGATARVLYGGEPRTDFERVVKELTNG